MIVEGDDHCSRVFAYIALHFDLQIDKRLQTITSRRNSEREMENHGERGASHHLVTARQFHESNRVSVVAMRRAILLGLIFLVATVGTVAAQPYGERRGPGPGRAVWDSSGWTLLGEQWVDGRRRSDRDRINVGRYEGRFSKLTIVVTDSDLEMLDFTVNFPRGQKWSPRVSHYFRENTRTRVIDLPGDDRRIESIDMRYRNLPGGGRAKVQVWGFKNAPPPPPPARFSWDNRGWTMLGEQVVDYGRRADRDRINVGRYEGRFSKLTIVVLDSDLELLNFQVNFPRGTAYAPRVNHYFRENQRTRVIDLPGDDRRIESIDLRYRNLPGGGRARVQVWGFKTTR